MDQVNPTSFNFISCNEFGAVWDNASLDRFELNNICYNQHNGIFYSSDNTSSIYQPYELLLSGNMMLNNDSFLPLFDYLSINGPQQGLTFLTKISTFLTYFTVVPMMTPFIFSKVANSFRNETKMFVRAQVFFGLIFLFFPVFLKIVKMSEEPPLIRETYY